MNDSPESNDVEVGKISSIFGPDVYAAYDGKLKLDKVKIIMPKETITEYDPYERLG